MPETCENCGATIGKLETPRVHEDHIVCKKCWDNLNADLPILESATEPIQRAAPAVVHRAVPIEPIQIIVGGPESRPVQTIEATGKFWKAQMLLSSLLLVVSGVALVLSLTGTINQQNFAWSMPGFAVGLIWHIVARIGAWWFHG